jgi:hypothetical protein
MTAISPKKRVAVVVLAVAAALALAPRAAAAEPPTRTPSTRSSSSASRSGVVHRDSAGTAAGPGRLEVRAFRSGGRADDCHRK